MKKNTQTANEKKTHKQQKKKKPNKEKEITE
jgi:hypothetical protein